MLRRLIPRPYDCPLPNEKKELLVRLVGWMDYPLVSFLAFLFVLVFLSIEYSFARSWFTFVAQRDWLIFISVLAYYGIWWFISATADSRLRGSSAEQSENTLAEQRKLGAETMRARITGGMTAIGILLAATLLLLQPAFSGSLPRGAIPVLVRAASWLFLSIGLSLWNLSTLTPAVRVIDVSRSPLRNLLAAAQNWGSYLGILNLAMAAMLALELVA